MCGSVQMNAAQEAASNALFAAGEQARRNKKGALTVAALEFARQAVVYRGVDDLAGLEDAVDSFVSRVNELTS